MGYAEIRGVNVEFVRFSEVSCGVSEFDGVSGLFSDINEVPTRRDEISIKLSEVLSGWRYLGIKDRRGIS